MRDAVIVDAVRTPIGKRGGVLSGVHPADLSAYVLDALARRTGIDPPVVDDVIWGVVAQVGDQAFNLARTAVLAAGWPQSVPGTTVDRQCGSSQQAVHFAAAGLIAGDYDVVVAGGVESMSRVPIGSSAASRHEGSSNQPYGPLFLDRYGAVPHQGLGAEFLATDEGRFARQIAPVTLADGTVVDTDEGIRRGGTAEQLAALKPVFRPDGRVTAAGSSQISDGAAALLLTTSEKAAALGLAPLARVHTRAIAADDPVVMLGAPIPATRKALRRSGLAPKDIGVFEVNEAFAAVPLAWLGAIEADPKGLNPNGGAIALGHPLGASGARLMTTMVHHMRDNGIRYGLQAMCEGGGLANATILEFL